VNELYILTHDIFDSAINQRKGFHTMSVIYRSFPELSYDRIK